jgi:hypothetical protein
MRESRSYGSVRGVAGDRYPYRDRLFCRERMTRDRPDLKSIGGMAF